MARRSATSGLMVALMGAVGSCGAQSDNPTGPSADVSLVGPDLESPVPSRAAGSRGDEAQPRSSRSEERVAGDAGCNDYFDHAVPRRAASRWAPLGSAAMAPAAGTA